MLKSLQKLVWVGIMLATFAGLIWYADKTGWSPMDVKAALFQSKVEDVRLFVPASTLDQHQARTLYKDSLDYLDENRYADALEGFKRLEPVYPGLLDMLLYHQSEAQSHLSNELGAQNALRKLLKKRPNSPLRIKAAYLMALSHFKAHEDDEALDEFKALRKAYPKSDYAVGSMYYIGLLHHSAGNTDEAHQYWMNYLKKCPKCTFSSDIADRIDETVEASSLTTEGHQAIGLGFASADGLWKKALPHLKLAPVTAVWPQLAKAYYHTDQKTDAHTVLMANIPYAKDQNQAQWAIDTLKLTSTDFTADLNRLNERALPFGGDYVLWLLANRDQSNTERYQSKLLTNYPESDYAPETSWQQLRPLLLSHQNSAFIEKAQRHLNNYAYSRSAPKVMFWVAKLLEADKQTEARTTYQTLLGRYPNTYYAMRATQRLDALSGGRDQGWLTRPSRTDYPSSMSWDLPGILPDPSKITNTESHQGIAPVGYGTRVYNAMKELMSIGARDDVYILAQEALPEMPAAIESWYLHQKGDKAKAIRIIRDDISQRALPKNNPHPENHPPLPHQDELKLQYPLYFSEHISTQASRQDLDPFLVQSLMREESYFNELAVSSSNARGLIQLLPSTAKEVAGWEGLSGFSTLDLFNPAINTQLGSRYLGHLHKLFNGNSLPSVGAYNGGPNAMKRWVNASDSFTSDPDWFAETIPYEQSRHYIVKVFESYWNYTRLYGKSPE